MDSAYRLHYRELPGKDPLHIYIHGATLNHTAWLVAAKEAGYRSILVDLRGHGKSPNFDSDFPLNPSTMYNDLEYTLYDVINVEERPPVLLGHSLGGMIAEMYAANHPELERLVLLSTTPNFKDSFERGVIRKTLSHLRMPGKGIIEIYQFFAHMFGNREMIDFSDPRIAKQPEELLPLLTDGIHKTGTFAQMLLDDKGVLSWDVAHYANRLRTPTTIIHGNQDWLVPPKSAEEHKRTIQEGIYGKRKDAPPVDIIYVEGVHCLTHKSPQLIASIIKRINGEETGGRNGRSKRPKTKFEPALSQERN